jgi:hypothetical protein
MGAGMGPNPAAMALLAEPTASTTDDARLVEVVTTMPHDLVDGELVGHLACVWP